MIWRVVINEKNFIIVGKAFSQAIKAERNELGKRIARQMGTSAVVADHYVDDIAKRILESDDEDEGPVN